MNDRFLERPLALSRDYLPSLLRRIESGRPNSGTKQGECALIGSIAVIDVSGVLVHSGLGSFEAETAYSNISAAFDVALQDCAVDAIALRIDSPGGEVAGCFDLADRIYAARGSKPIWAILDESAFSAAYALASAADKIVVPRTGGTGSIGVVSLRLDITKALDQAGLAVHTIQYGEHKTESYPTTPMTAEARKRLQVDVDTLGEMFVDLVARNRKLSTRAVRAMQASTFVGRGGYDVGLADAVMPPADAFRRLLDRVS